jgi:nicotinamidase-related amidase
MEQLSKNNTALVIIDLQKGIASLTRPLGPYSAKEVITNASILAEVCRKDKIPVFLVHVMPSAATRLNPISDSKMSTGNPPEDWAEFIPEIGPKEGDILITKQQWGAFYGTDLDLQLRRRNINTIILCGISTNIGVESTARFAYEYGYNQIFAEDAMTAKNKEEHEMSVNSILKRIGIVRKTKEIIEIINS